MYRMSAKETCSTTTSESIVEPKLYDVFRKKFHIPSHWQSIDSFTDLVEHKYLLEQAPNTFSYIEERLKKMGYAEDNDNIVNVYLHYMIYNFDI